MLIACLSVDMMPLRAGTGFTLSPASFNFGAQSDADFATLVMARRHTQSASNQFLGQADFRFDRRARQSYGHDDALAA